MPGFDLALTVGVLATCAVVGVLLGRLGHYVAKRFTSRTAIEWDDALLDALRAPFGFGLFVFIAHLVTAMKLLPESTTTPTQKGLGALVYIAIFFALVRLVDAVRLWLESSGGPARRDVLGLIQIGGRLAKLLLVALCVLSLLSHFGFSVGTFVAGLGLGGLALGLAAQKTLGNLFGGVSLALDQPFRTGDFVKAGDLVGTVEALGLRSTRIRTLDRTLVTIPNGDLGDTRIESYAARDRMRLSCTIGLVYSTRAETLATIVEKLRQALRDHPKIWPDNIHVFVVAFGASSIDIEVMAWFHVADWSEFCAVRQEVLLSFMRVVEGAGSSFAFPTQTIHLEQEAPEAGPA